MSRGQLSIVGIGPGGRDLLTPQALAALREADVVLGYAGYFAWVQDLLAGKERIALPIGAEQERARLAIERTISGCRVALISSGDPGIYAMASVVIERLEAMEARSRPRLVVVPGVSALNAAAALLGAPLGHDFAVISLSDLLTPWHVIEKRLEAAAAADFVLALFNPRSQERDWQLDRARSILLRHRLNTTPVGIVRNAFRPDESILRTHLAEMDPLAVDMFSLVIVGSTTSRFVDDWLLTPRGYKQSGEGKSA